MIVRAQFILILVFLVLLPIEGPIDPDEDDDRARIELVFMGDIAFNNKIPEMIDSKGPGYPFKHIVPQIERADLRFANLETPISQRGHREVGKYSTFRADPEVIDSLLYADIDVVSLANNHCLDYGLEALNDTMDNLEKAGIRWSGIWDGEDPEDLSTEDALILEIEGIRIGFLACTEDVRDHWTATGHKLGPIPLEIGLMERKVRSLRSEVDILIVSIHWRKWPQYTDSPEPSDRQICYSIIDAGADIIMGHGPHTVHEVEGYNDGLILYSLGNVAMINNNMSSERSYIAKVYFTRKGHSSIELVPLALGNNRYVPMGSPLLKTNEEHTNVSLSEVRNMYRTDDYGFIDDESGPSGMIGILMALPGYVWLIFSLVLVLLIPLVILFLDLWKKTKRKKMPNPEKRLGLR